VERPAGAPSEKAAVTQMSQGAPVPALPRRALPHAGVLRSFALYSIIVTAKMKDVDPQVSLADVPARIADQPVHRIDDLPPWN